MTTSTRHFPVVLAIGRFDPTGGSGLLADSEAIASMGAHATCVATAIAIQDTETVKAVTPVPTIDVIAQSRAILEDIPVDAVKIGALTTPATAEAVYTILGDYPRLPVVVHASAANEVDDDTDEELLDRLTALLCPRATLLLSTTGRARMMAPEADSIAAVAQQIMSCGSQYVLLTDVDETAPVVVNELFGHMNRVESFRWDRLPERFMGAGCTLSSAIAALLAHGLDMFNSCNEGQEYTMEALRAARRLGNGRLVPTRLYWLQTEKGGPS